MTGNCELGRLSLTVNSVSLTTLRPVISLALGLPTGLPSSSNSPCTSAKPSMGSKKYEFSAAFGPYAAQFQASTKLDAVTGVPSWKVQSSRIVTVQFCWSVDSMAVATAFSGAAVSWL